MTVLLGAMRHAFRRWRVDKLPIAALVVTVTLTSALAAALPRVATRTADEALRSDAATVDEAARTMFIASTRFQPDVPDAFLEEQVSHAAELLGRAPGEVRAMTAPPAITIDARRYVIAPDAGRPRAGAFLTVRLRPGLGDQVQLVEGRLPLAVYSGKVFDERLRLTIEIGVARATADVLVIGVGDRFPVDPDPNAGPQFGNNDVDITLEVTGIFEPIDAASPYWAHAAQLISPSTFDMGESQTIFVTVAAGEEGLAAIASTFETTTTTAIYPLRVDDLVARDAPALLRAFDALPIAYRGIGDGFSETITARSGFGNVLERFIAAEAATARLLSLALASLAGVAMLAIVLLAVLLAVRRRPVTQLERQRGASWPQVVVVAAVEAVALAGGSSLIGLLVSRALLPGGDEGPSIIGAAGVAVAVAAALVAARAASLADLRQRPVETIAGERPARRRLAAEFVIVLIAALGIYLLRSRGLAGSAEPGIDPFLAAVPLLAALAMGLLVLRAYPYPLLGLADLLGRGRGFTASFALRRAGTGQSQRLPVVALLLATALGVFGATLATSIENGQALAALEQVGADYRVEAVTGPNPSRLGIAELPGVEATAAAWVVPDAPIITATRRGGADARLVAVDVAGFENVSSRPLPAALTEAPSPDAPLPAVISANLGPGTTINRGDTFSVAIAGGRVEMLAVDVRTSFPAIASGERFVVTSLAAMEARLDRTLAPTQLLVRGGPALAGSIRDRALELGAVSVVIARDETLAAVRDAPFSVAVVNGYTLSLLIAALYVLVAVVIGLLLGREARERDLAHLRTMGLGRRDIIALTALEQVPMPIIGVTAGTALGLLLVALVGPGLDLAAFTGTEQPVPLSIPWLALVGLAAGFAAVMLVVTLVASLSAQAVDPARALRLGDT